MSSETLSSEGLREIENGSAQAWASLSPAKQAEMVSWGFGAPAATDSKAATADTSATAAPEIGDATLTDAQRVAAEALLHPPARPQDYRLPDAPPGMDRLAPNDDKMLREFCHTSALGQGEATWVTNEVYRAARQMQELQRGNPSTLGERTYDAIVLTGNQCAAELSRVWGADYEKNMVIARAEAARLTKAHPEIYRILETTTLGNSVPLIRLLVERVERRAGKG